MLGGCGKEYVSNTSIIQIQFKKKKKVVFIVNKSNIMIILCQS